MSACLTRRQRIATARQYAWKPTLSHRRRCLHRGQHDHGADRGTQPRVPSAGLVGSEIDEFLSKPTWSVRSLLPPSTPSASEETIPKVTSKQLHHLLRLSALPAPKDLEEETRMLNTLSAQLHFVKAIQQIDTTGVEPLQSLRDETKRGEKEHTYDMESMRDALVEEEVVGTWHKRIRRKGHQDLDGNTKAAEDWDVLGSAERKVGKFFVVEGAPREE